MHLNTEIFNTQTLLLVGVAAQLLGSLAKHVWTRPAQQAQIDRIEAQVSQALSLVTQITPPTLTRAPGASTASAGKDDGQP